MSREIISPIKILIILNLLILILLLLPSVDAAPLSSRSSWVFWYYSSDGNRNCGNYCYLVFSLVAAIILCICGCGCLRCYFIRKHYKAEKLESNINTQQILEEWEHELQMSEQQQQQNQLLAQQQLQYPPLTHSRDTPYDSSSTAVKDDDNIPPPLYSNNTFNAELHKHALRQESNWDAYKAGRQFTRDNPPKEILPPQEHLNYIKELGGVEAWKFIPESSVLQLNIASVTNDHIVSFHAKLDAMMQTNYPLLDMEYSKLPSNNIPSTNNDDKRKSIKNDDNRKSIKSNNLTVNTTALNMNHNNESSNNISPMTMCSTNTYHSKLYLISPNSPNSPNSPLPPQSPTITNTTATIIDAASSSSPPPPPPPSYTPQSFALQPPTDSWFYYFEITVLSNPNNDATIAIGLATKPYPTFRLPGCNFHSVGFHSNEGKKLHNEGLTGVKYDKKWGEVGDVIGCGYYPSTGQVFFTKNGKNLGIAYTGLFHIWFPTIGSDGVCSLKVNFGQEEFKYRRANGMSVAGIIPQNIIDQSIEEESNEEEEE